MEKFLCVNAMVSTTSFQIRGGLKNMSYDDETEDYYEMLDKQFEEDELISFIVAWVLRTDWATCADDRASECDK